jgi:hypothetical protein
VVLTVPGYTPPVTRATFRRSAIAAAVVGAVALAVLAPLGYVAYAVFGCVGLALGVLNSYLTMRAVVRFAETKPSRARFSASVLGRLGVITLAAFACVLLFPQTASIAVFGGLIVFQFLGIASSLLPLIKEIRQK